MVIHAVRAASRFADRGGIEPFRSKEYIIWYVEILQHNGEKSIYRLSDKYDGEELIDLLETCMRKK